MDKPRAQQDNRPGNKGGRQSIIIRQGAKGMKRKTVTGAGICLISLISLLSCGLESFYYIDYIPEGTMSDPTYAEIQLPSSSTEGYSSYFINFAIFYRIYISGEALSGLINTSSLRNQVNSALNSDYQSLYSLTDITSTTVNTQNLENAFFIRKYFKLVLEGENIGNVLGRNSLGKTLKISFDPRSGVTPVLIIDDIPYTLQRAVSGQNILFSPVPDNRYFMNHPDLYNNANVTNEINADVAANTRTSPELRYTYVSMYIAAIGGEFITSIFIQPTHIGIFRLPEAF
jgi:hypothetical protein